MFKRILKSFIKAMEISSYKRVLVEAQGVLSKEQADNIRARIIELQYK
jgi:hypothetical protein